MAVNKTYMTRRITKIDMEMLEGFPGGMPFPQNIPCPARCKFCYEYGIVNLFPWLKAKCIPPFNTNSFRSYLNKKDLFVEPLLARGAERPRWPILKRKEGFFYFPKCDFFSLGLTHQQIELILKYGKPLIAFTTGLNVDPDIIGYFVKKYPKKFSVHLSVITFDPIIRSQIMHTSIDIGKLKKISKLIKNSTYFLLFFGKKRMISDIGFLNEFSVKNKNDFMVGSLYYNRVSPAEVRECAHRAEGEWRSSIDYLVRNSKKLKNISSRIRVFPDSYVFAWLKRRELKSLLSPCKDVKTSAVFCTRGAYREIRSLFKEASVISVDSCFGGNIDFVFGMTARAIIAKIRDLLDQKVALNDIYIPSNMFIVPEKYDFNLDRVELIKQAFPKLNVTLITVPLLILREGSLTLDQCWDYYSHND